MPRPLNNKRSAATLVAAPSSLADALGMGRTNLQEAAAAQQAATCTAAPTSSESHDIDVESEGGLSEDDNEESSILRRDILHDRQQAYRSVVAPSTSCTTAAAAAPTNNVSESDDDDEQSIPTRPASVDNQVPSASTEAPESSSTPAKPIQAGGYTEDDWDRPTGQTSFWYDDARYYDHMHDAEMNGTEPSMHAFVSAAPLATSTPVPEEFESEVNLVVAAPKPRRVRASASGVYGQVTYESESDDESELENQRMGTVAPEPEDVAEGQFSQRQDTEPYHHHYGQDDQYNHHEEAEYYAEQQEQHYHPHEEEEDTYNPECPCELCVDAFVAQQRRDIDTRWGHRFPQAAPVRQQQNSHVVAPRSQQMQQQQQQMPRHPRGSKGGNPNAIVACCYFKQKGFCKMGADCWYSHDADDSTPCHYGALCKAAGHKQLVKNGSNVPPVQRPGFGPGPFVTHPTMPAMSSVIPRIRATVPANKPATAPRPAALLVPSVAPCAFCGASPQTVMTQEFPVYNGSTRTVGLRAHCTDCLRTYSL